MREMNQILEYRWTQGIIPREDDTNLQKISQELIKERSYGSGHPKQRKQYVAGCI